MTTPSLMDASPAHAVARSMLNLDASQPVDPYDLEAAEDIVRQLRRLGWIVVPWNVGIGDRGGPPPSGPRRNRTRRAA